MAEYAAVAAAVVAVVAAGVGTYVAVKSSEAQAEQAQAIRKQKIQEKLAAEESAAFEERQHRRRINFLIGQQRAIYGASGVDPGSGSPLLQDIDLVRQGELEALNVRRYGALAAQSSEFESRIAKFQRDTIRGAIPYQIAGGVLGAASSGLSAYSAYSDGSSRSGIRTSNYGDDYSGSTARRWYGR